MKILNYFYGKTHLIIEQSTVEHYLSIRVEKGDATYYLEETLDVPNVYNKAQLLKGAENYPQDIQDFLKNNLPEEFI